MITIPQTVTLAAGSVTWLCGVALVKHISFFRRYNLPAPVVGGIVIAVALALVKAAGFEPPTFDTRLVSPLMIAFFTSVGYSASIGDLISGGKAVIYFLVACTVLLLLQVAAGVVVAHLTGQHPLFGVITSSVALVGGPATALSFAPEFEKAGVNAAATVGVAAAMLGIVFGGLIGSPIATMLVGKQNPAGADTAQGTADPAPAAEDAPVYVLKDQVPLQLMYHIACVLIVGSIGYYLSMWVASMGLKLPFYVGAMVAAFFVRALEDKFECFRLDKDWIDAVGNVCLVLFVSVSMMTLDLSAVAAVAGPLLLVLAVQAVLVATAAVTVMFRVMGRDYEAAVISGGLIGFMMGTTANAMATMKAVTEKFGPAPRAFLVVPIVGACFIDFVNALVISISLNIWGI